MPTPVRHLALVAALALAGCSGGGGDGADGEAGTTEGGTGGDATSDGGTSGDPDSGGTDGGTTAEPEPFEPILARGIRVTRGEINQGVAVPIALDGAWAGAEDRNAPIVHGRDALFRFYWELDADFEPRELEGRFTLTAPGEDPQLAKQKIEISQDAVETSLQRSFYWVVPGQIVVPGVKFEFEIYETGPGYEDTPEPTPPPRAVHEPGNHVVGVEQDDQVLKVTIVRVQHELDGDTCIPPEFTDADIADIADRLHVQNPTMDVQVTLRPQPMVFAGSMSSFDPVLADLSGLRFDDNADPTEYYYGLIRACDGGPSNGGKAIAIPDFPDQGNLWQHTAVSKWYVSGYNHELIVHEMGHLLGRRHVVCNGEEQGADPYFPYGDNIGVWGFDISKWELQNPTASTDYMSYCYATNWVSDYGWSEVYPFITEVTSWGQGGGIVQPPGEVLVGLVGEDGEETWFRTEGRAESLPRLEGAAELTVGGQPVPRTLHGGPMGDGGQVLVVELGDGQGDSLEAVTWTSGGRAGQVSAASIR